MKVFITYGDNGYESAKEKIKLEAERTRQFNTILAYSREDISPELLSSDIINVKRGGGLWSWKPDVILKTMNTLDDGDIIVYCDAGCSLYKANEWNFIWKVMRTHDILAQRSLHRTDKYTRKELIDSFIGVNGDKWPLCYQYIATVIIIRVTDLTKQFIKEWRDSMVMHPELIYDVTAEALVKQQKTFIENRHDQSLYSALIYKYLKNLDFADKIYTKWEHIDYCDPIFKQAIRATRLRQGQQESPKIKFRACIKRILKYNIYKPLYYSPLQWWRSKL